MSCFIIYDNIVEKHNNIYKSWTFIFIIFKFNNYRNVKTLTPVCFLYFSLFLKNEPTWINFFLNYLRIIIIFSINVKKVFAYLCIYFFLKKLWFSSWSKMKVKEKIWETYTDPDRNVEIRQWILVGLLEERESLSSC